MGELSKKQTPFLLGRVTSQRKTVPSTGEWGQNAERSHLGLHRGHQVTTECLVLSKIFLDKQKKKQGNRENKKTPGNKIDQEMAQVLELLNSKITVINNSFL